MTTDSLFALMYLVVMVAITVALGVAANVWKLLQFYSLLVHVPLLRIVYTQFQNQPDRPC